MTRNSNFVYTRSSNTGITAVRVHEDAHYGDARASTTWMYLIISSLSHWDSRVQSMIPRLIVVILAFVLGFSAICYRLVTVALIKRDEMYHYVTERPVRREIVDRNGSLLVTNIPISSLFANPKHMVDIKNDVEKLSHAIADIDKEKLLSELSVDKSFVWIKRDITPKDEQKINALGIPGLYFEKDNKRLYVNSNITSHLLGYVGRDNQGLAGAEKYHDKLLCDANAQPLKLTIDSRVQNIVSEELDRTIKQFSAVGAVGIVADPNTGEIIALVSKPDFDPHNISSAKNEMLFNRASLGVYETGSVAKALSFAIAFDTDIITMHDAYDLTHFRVANFNVKDYHKTSGWHSVPEIFLHSSNIGVGQIALEAGSDKFQSYFKSLGMLDQLELEIPERAIPLYPKTERWDDLSLTTMSYGYAVSISPLHFMRAMLPVVNGGILRPLTLVKNDSDPAEGKRVFKESTSDSMRKLMRLTVSRGTAKKADVPGYLVGGKTGTAELQEGKKYVHDKRRATFFGIVPAIDPKYAIYIMIDEPKGTKETFGFATGGWAAAPAVKNIIARMVALYGMQPYDMSDPSIQEALHVDCEIDVDT